MDVTVNARPGAGVLLQGGVSTGRTSTDNCDIRDDVPEIGAVNPYCHVDTKFLTQVKLLGTYTVPKVDVQVAATFQSLPGPQITANYVATNALVQPSLGRPLSGGAPNVTVNLVTPGTMYGERLNQLDLRFAQADPLRADEAAVNFDLYNALNGNAGHVPEQQLRGLAGAAEHPGRPAVQDQRAVRLLMAQAIRPRTAGAPAQ